MANDTRTADAPTLDWAKFGWEAAKGIAVAIAAVYSFFANQHSTQNADALAKLKLDSDSRAQQSALDIKVYELVEKALSLDGPSARSHGVAAAALINALTAPPLRGQLLNALRAGATDKTLIQELDDAQTFDSQSYPVVTPTSGAADAGHTSRLRDDVEKFIQAFVPHLLAQGLPGALKGYHVDILYCEGQSAAQTDARRKRAQAASDRLKPAGSDIIVRVRSLPTLVQARPEYKSVADEIRFDDEPAEREAAKLLATIGGIRPDSMRKANRAKTPGYISLFYCAD